MGVSSVQGIPVPKVVRSQCRVGESAWSPGDQYLNASLDDLRVYNRELSAADVSRLYVRNPL